MSVAHLMLERLAHPAYIGAGFQCESGPLIHKNNLFEIAKTLMYTYVISINRCIFAIIFA